MLEEHSDSYTNCMRMHRVKVFSSDPNYGNLAGVISEAGSLTSTEMLSLSSSIGASESSFITDFSGDSAVLRIFSPTKEIEFCVHATLAALVILKDQQQLGSNSLRVELKGGISNAFLMGDKAFMSLNPCHLSENCIPTSIVCKLLNIAPENLVGEPRIAVILSDRELVVPVKSLIDLANLQPSFKRYGELCRKLDLNGISIFCNETQDNNNDLHMREFAPLYGYLEDPLCGTGAAAVSCYISEIFKKNIQSLKIEQGLFMGTSGIIEVTYSNRTIQVGGQYSVLNQEQYLI